MPSRVRNLLSIKVAVAAGHGLKNESKMRSATDLMVSDQTPEDAPRRGSILMEEGFGERCPIFISWT